MRRLRIIKAGGQHTVKTPHVVIISRPNSTHSLVKVLVPVVSIFELTNAILTRCQFCKVVGGLCTLGQAPEKLIFPRCTKKPKQLPSVTNFLMVV